MYFKYNDINLYYEKYGDGGKTIIILPGWGDTRKSFYYLINILRNFYTIYILDYPGFSNTEFPDYELTIYDYSLMINEWIKSLNVKNPYLIGHSFGGRIIITLLGYYDMNYKNIILINSAGIRPKKTLKKLIRTYTYKFLKKIANILPKKYRNNYLTRIFNIFSSSDYRSLPNNMRNTFKNIVNEDLKDYLSNIKSNTLIIWGGNDTSTPISDGIMMNKLIKNSKIHIFDDAGHFSYLDYPIEIIKIISEFID